MEERVFRAPISLETKLPQIQGTMGLVGRQLEAAQMRLIALWTWWQLPWESRLPAFVSDCCRLSVVAAGAWSKSTAIAKTAASAIVESSKNLGQKSPLLLSI